MNAEGAELGDDLFADRDSLPLHDRWILSRLNKTARDVNAALAAYGFHEAVQTIYHFFWDDFCDWYIELTKATITAAEDSAERADARARMIWILEKSLRLLHPFMPYITEELWQRLPVKHAELLHAAYAGASPTIMLAGYPQGEPTQINERAEAEMRAVIDLVTRVRNIRSEMNIKPGDRVPVLIGAADEQLRSAFTANTDQIARLARASSVSVSARLTAPQASARAALAGGAELAVPLEGLIDFEQERARLNRDRDKLQAEAAKLEAQLANPQFVERAPAEKVSEAQARIADIQQRMSVLAETIEGLK
jgi:valyl-tRNA synthetase